MMIVLQSDVVGWIDSEIRQRRMKNASDFFRKYDATVCVTTEIKESERQGGVGQSCVVCSHFVTSLLIEIVIELLRKKFERITKD